MSLFQDSGSTPEARRVEADRLIEIIEEFSDQLSPTELSFVCRLNGDFQPVSLKQLFWLRDIKDRHL